MKSRNPRGVTHAGGRTSEPEPLTVRAATVEDAERLLSVFHWLMAPPGARPNSWHDEAGAAALRRVIASGSSAALLAESGGELVGGCTVFVDILSVRFGQRAWVEDLAVHPAHRSHGIGALLLDAAKGWAHERGATHLELESSEARLDAPRFYQRQDPAWVSHASAGSCEWHARSAVSCRVTVARGSADGRRGIALAASPSACDRRPSRPRLRQLRVTRRPADGDSSAWNGRSPLLDVDYPLAGDIRLGDAAIIARNVEAACLRGFALGLRPLAAPSAAERVVECRTDLAHDGAIDMTYPRGQ